MKESIAFVAAWFLALSLLVFTIVGLTRCGTESAQAGGSAYADTISGPGGYTCFAIYNSGGSAVGGNCVKD